MCAESCRNLWLVGNCRAQARFWSGVAICRSGRKTVMHLVVEPELARICIYLHESNISIHRALIQIIAFDIALAMGVPKDSFEASEKWFHGLKARHPTLASRKACKFNRARNASCIR